MIKADLNLIYGITYDIDSILTKTLVFVVADTKRIRD